MRAALLIVAACSSAPKPAASYTLRPLVLVEWHVHATANDTTLALRVGDQRIELGTYPGGVHPAWQTYCERKGGTLEHNIDVAKRYGAFAKLTITPANADIDEPTPPGAVTFLVKSLPSPNRRERLEVWELGATTPRATIPIASEVRVEERLVIDAGFSCSDAHVIDI